MKIRAQQNWGRCQILPLALKSNRILVGLFSIIVVVISLQTMRTIIQSTNLSANETSLNIRGSTSSSELERGGLLSASGSYHSKIRIVMFIGIEGTGHHFWQALMKESPLYQRLLDLDLHPRFTKQILRNLYRHSKGRWHGLWSGTCKWNVDDPPTNVTSIHETIVGVLRNMTHHIETEKSLESTQLSQVVMPINLLGMGQEVGFVSYPGFLKPCRALNYPNLDVWYAACETAKVQCQHVYIYRNPYAVVRSTTTNRPLNADTMDAIHLYTTQLQVLHSQLLSHPRRLVGCWNYDAVLSPIQFQNEIDPLFEFQNAASFKKALQKVFLFKKAPTTEEQQRKIVPAELDLYMKSLIRVHEMVIHTCTGIRAQNTL